ncbi:MAG: peptidase M23 [Mongoliibacter sp.]|uniref:peptidoglycan DD-metalloendopeptidase family protein n=1 Tax=Mongoliibacter sp. TaxID=2022438 RepID=UPI0012F31FE3|nr:peptidoglycan DD-metalloendopeptidase family protein [Mongoliibacter sp.]TVP51746.1 MAG: peptidase M23 [Mongoliibacter sp.]
MVKKWIGISALVVALIGGYFIVENRKSNAQEIVAEDFDIEEEEEIIEEENLLYGIAINGLQITEGVVGKNQTLSSILSPFNVPYEIIDQIAKKSKDIFDVRKIAFNKKFTVLTPIDSSQAQFFIYEPNASEYVVFRLDDGEIYKEEKPIELRHVEKGGVISNNLSSNMGELDITNDLIDQFADLFGWYVNFQGLQKGDIFKVAYKEKVVDGNVVGVTDIEAAYFQHKGQEYHAIPFEQNGEVNFFDQEGHSFKKSFLRDPVKYTRISSKYNPRRFHPVQKRYKPHLGTDYAAATGTEIRTVGDGTVVEARYTSANGNFVKIKHNDTYTTQYLHMSKIASGMKPGARVKQGQVIGFVGSTGLATGPHLCFRFWKNGKQVDWLAEKLPPSDPISKQNWEAFEKVKLEKINQIASIEITDKKEPLLAEK